MIGIYSFKNIVNDKRYIGQSINIESRYTTHLNLAQKEDNEVFNKVLYQAFRKYGLENFEFEVLEEVDRDLLDEREIFWVDKFDTFKNGYNVTKGGAGVIGLVGEEVYCAKLTNEEVIQIKDLLRHTKLQQVEIGSMYGATKNVISAINSGKSWASVGSRDFPIRDPAVKTNPVIFTDEEVIDFRRRYVSEESQILYQECSHRCSLSTFRSMLNGNRYKHLPYYKKMQKIWLNGHSPQGVI